MSRKVLSEDEKKKKIAGYVDGAVFDAAKDYGNMSEWMNQAGHFFIKWSPMIKREEIKFERKTRMKIKELVNAKKKKIRISKK